jgi:hypothetical protein
MRTNAAADFNGVALGDERLNARARTTVQALSAQPALGAPRVLSEAELEGYYRFVNNKRVSFEALLKAHVEATIERAKGLERVVVAHDTTDFRFSDEVARLGLGPMDNGGQGFYAHVSLALATRQHALGVVAVEPWTRTSRKAKKVTQGERYRNPAKESLRWMRAIREAERVFEGRSRLIHVMDREADDYDILCALVASKYSFVVRGSYDRRLAGSDVRLKTFARTLEVRCTRNASLVRRAAGKTAKQRKLHPARDARIATLTFSAERVTLRRPDDSDAEAEELTINLVRAFEPDPPPDCEPIEWFLLTSEPIDTPEQILQVVDDYRARWTVEEYFKALKTGCAYEKRQHETKDALLNALGIFIPIAWSLLNMRTLSRDEELAKRPAEELLTPTQLEIIRLESKNKLCAQPTIGEAVLLLARFFGGLQPSNGRPGWHILGRAFEKLLTMEAGWRLAMATLAPLNGRSDR